MQITREALYKELRKTFYHIIHEMCNIKVASHYVRLLEKKNPKATRVLCKKFNCIFNEDELDMIAKMARSVFNDLIPSYVATSECPTTTIDTKKVSNILKFPKRARNGRE